MTRSKVWAAVAERQESNRVHGRACMTNGGPCHTYSGSFTVTVDREPASLTLTASKSLVKPNTPVAFTAAVTPSTVSGQSMPFKLISWNWQPDSGTAVSACAAPSVTPNPAVCNYTPPFSGTMHIEAFVNGSAASADVRVDVRNPTLTLTAVPDNVIPYDTVTFNATVTPSPDAWSITGWSWTADASVSALKAPTRSGVSLDVVASPTGCSVGSPQCQAIITSAGTMTVTALIDGVQRQASAHVTVRPPSGGAGTDSLPYWWFEGASSTDFQPDSVSTSGLDDPCPEMIHGGAKPYWVTIQNVGLVKFWFYAPYTKVSLCEPYIGLSWRASYVFNFAESDETPDGHKWLAEGQLNLQVAGFDTGNVELGYFHILGPNVNAFTLWRVY